MKAWASLHGGYLSKKLTTEPELGRGSFLRCLFCSLTFTLVVRGGNLWTPGAGQASQLLHVLALKPE